MGTDPVAVARENVEAFNAGEWERFMATLTEDSVYSELATQRRVTNAADILELNKGWKAAFPDARGTVTSECASGSTVTLEIRWEGTQSGELAGPLGTVPASNRRVVVPAAQIFEIVDGRIKEARHYFDLMGLLQQIGALPQPASAG